MKIAQVVPIWFPVPPQKFGGLELVVSNLTDGLIKKGHEVALYGFSDKNILIKSPSLNAAPLTVDWLTYKNFELDNFIQAISDSDDYDILHFHISTDLFPLIVSKFSKKPTLITLHNFSVKSEDNFIFTKYDNNLVCPNRLLVSLIPKNNKTFTVYHGINVSDYEYSEKKEDYFVYLSRVEPKKGILDAIAVTKALNKKLFILGPIPPLQKEFFEKEVKPQLSNNIEYVGEADLKMKNQYLSKAKALLFPTQYEETFGLVAAEAMACGTPVVSYNIGAVSEVIIENETGFIAEMGDSVKLTEAADKLLGLNQEEYIQMVKKCRQHVEEKFSIDKMTDGYLKVYQELIGD